MFMKKILVTLVLVLSSVSIYAEENGIFNHMSVAVELGSTGIGFELAAPIGNYVAVRAGMDFMPSFKYNTTIDVGCPQGLPDGMKIPTTVDIEGKDKFTNGKLLFDCYPFRNSSFHVTAGAYIGSKEVIDVYNKEDGALKDIVSWNKQRPEAMIGAELGDYFLTPDDQGNVNADVRTKSFRPYVGLGFGRAVPQKHRFTCAFDAGVMFWGKPEIYLRDTKVEASDIDGDGGSIAKTMTKIQVWPCLSLRVIGRIF